MIIDCALGGVNISADLVQYSACQLQTRYTYYVGFCGKFGCCWPSAADEEWYSPKRPSSTVAVNELNTKVSAFFP